MEPRDSTQIVAVDFNIGVKVAINAMQFTVV